MTTTSGVPWWCMYADHPPFDKEGEYVSHMLEIHGIDFQKGKMLPTATRAWQCGDTRHAPYSSEQNFLEHLVNEHGLADRVNPPNATSGT